MTVIGIICEYNPFHNGHKYQIEEIRRQYGNDAVIVCIISGSFVQRGDVAIIDKYTRAQIAVENGASLVLELPFPYCTASAEFFADAGIEILDRLGCIDKLCFGSECGDIKKISSVARRMSSNDFSMEFALQRMKKENKKLGYAQILEKTCKTLFTNEEEFDIIKDANNILAIEYVRALIRKNSKIEPITVLRKGQSHNDAKTVCKFSSASAIRNAIYENNTEGIKSSVPENTANEISNAIKNGKIHRFENLSDIILSHFRLYGDDYSKADLSCGVLNRIVSLSRRSTSVTQMLEALSTKKYTNAYLRRAILFSMLNVNEKQLRQAPEYTTLLAADEYGTALLASTRRTRRINILTKPADYTNLFDSARKQVIINNRADSIYSLSSHQKGTEYDFLRKHPFIKK